MSVDAERQKLTSATFKSLSRQLKKAVTAEGLFDHFAPELMQEAAYAYSAQIPRKWAPHEPFPGPQTDFDSSQEKEVFYGGAAGGGKSEMLLRSALKYVHIPEYAALLLRRTYTDLSLPGAMMPRLDSWLRGTAARWDGTSKTWRFPSGARISFGYLEKPNDHLRYQSTEFQYIGFDEVTQFEEYQYLYLFSRLRRTMALRMAGVPLRMRAASNPGGPGHDWVNNRFRLTKTDGRRFIPARLKDNPALDQKEYIESLGELDEVTRAQLLEGDWDVIDEGLLSWTTIRDCEAPNILWKQGAIQNPREPHFLGFDVGRTKDLTVVWTLQQRRDQLITREVEVLFNMPFKKQKDFLREKFETLNIVAARGDKGGIGMQMCEELQEEYPHIFEGVALGSRAQGRIGKLLKTSLLNRQLVLPQDEEIRRDFRLVKKIDDAGDVPVLKTNRGGGSHADRFWACGLARLAAGLLEIPQDQTGLPTGRRYGT